MSATRTPRNALSSDTRSRDEPFFPARTGRRSALSPGVRQVVNLTFFGGQYKDNRSRESWYSHRCAVGNTPVVRPGRRLSTGARKPETARTKSRNSREASRMHENHGGKRVGSLPPGC